MFKKLSAAALATAFLAVSPFAASAQEVTLRLHQLLPLKAAIPAQAITPWIEKVQSESGGRIKVEHYPSMQLGGKPPSLFDQAKDGVVDIVWTVLGYTPGRFPKTEAFELPFMTGDAESASRAFHEYAAKNAMNEFVGVKVIAFHVHGPGLIHSNKPVSKLEDLQGQKLRGPTRIITAMLGKLGATAVGMPVPAVPESVSKGVIDGAVIPWEVTLPLKMTELVSNHAGFASYPGMYTATFVFAMNQGSYDGLPDDLKKVIDDNSGIETAALFGRAMDTVDKIGLAKAEKSGNTIVIMDDAEKARWMEAAAPLVDEWIADMKSKGIDGNALVEDAKALIKKHGGM